MNSPCQEVWRPRPCPHTEVAKQHSPTGERYVVKPYPKDNEARPFGVRQDGLTAIAATGRRRIDWIGHRRTPNFLRRRPGRSHVRTSPHSRANQSLTLNRQSVRKGPGYPFGIQLTVFVEAMRPMHRVAP